jgi:hypothetical protein
MDSATNMPKGKSSGKVILREGFEASIIHVRAPA